MSDPYGILTHVWGLLPPILGKLDEWIGGAGDGTRTRNVLFGKQKLYH